MEESYPTKKRKRVWYSPIGLAQRILVSAILVYLGLCGYLYVIQDSQIYPRKLYGGLVSPEYAIREAKAEGLVPWNQPTQGAASPQGYVAPDFARSAPRGTIVVFHGNGGWAAQRTAYLDALGRRGFRTFLYEYPGYGGRPGEPSERAIVPDARALVLSLDREGYGPVYVWGESLGAGVACAVVADRALPAKGLALLCPWDTIAHVALFRFPYIPVQFLLTDTYDSIGNLSQFRAPVCVVRGTRDDVVPPALTANLYSRLSDPKKMIVQEGYGHEDWSFEPNAPWWDEALNFIAPKK